MQANDIKKGMQITTKSGFNGTMEDNKKGITRLIKVDGLCGPELGSEYIFKLRRVFNPETEKWEEVELSPAQQKQAALIRAAGF